MLTVILAVVNGLKQANEDEHEYQAERRSAQKEFEIACEVQVRLLPSQAPDYPRLGFGYFYQSARQVGGDYYDFIPLNPAQMGLAVADVSGKGLSSSLLMASLQGLVRTNLAVRQGEVARFVTELNDSFYKLTAKNRYATIFFAVVDVSNQTLHYVNAGQNPPLLFKNGTSPANVLGTTERLECGGPPVGLFARSQYRSEHVPLHDGDVRFRMSGRENWQEIAPAEEAAIRGNQISRETPTAALCLQAVTGTRNAQIVLHVG